jgi:hypothetical protein
MKRSIILWVVAMVFGLPAAVIALFWITLPSTAESERLIAALKAGPRPASELFNGEWSRICLGAPYGSPTGSFGADDIGCEGWRTGDSGDEGTSFVVLLRGAPNAAVSCKAVLLPLRSLLVTKPGCRLFNTAQLGIATSADKEATILHFVPVEGL